MQYSYIILSSLRMCTTFIDVLAGVFFLVLHAWAANEFEYEDVIGEIS